MIDGVVSNPFLASTLAPRTEPLENYVEEIIALSRLKYSNRKEDVEMEIGKEFKKTNSLENVGQAKSNSNEKRETILYEAVCSNCNKKIQVPFKPDPNRPVYCKNCLKKIRAKTSKPEVLKQ
jgi:CxxC-x17-CxxC domain-containing protein